MLEALDPQPGEHALDCTAGAGGHAAAIAERLGPSGRLTLLDADADNLAYAAARVRERAPLPALVTRHTNFAAAPRLLANESAPPVHTVLADLGFASNHVDDPSRGFAFRHDGPLDMRFDPTRGLSARDLVNDAPEAELSRIFREWGEEPAARRVAAALVAARAAGPIETTGQLADIVRSVVGRSARGIDPATRCFQGLRIAVNDELGTLGALLGAIERAAAPSAGRGDFRWLAPGARIVFLTFHSLEDRPVKAAFASLVRKGWASDLAPGGGTAGPDEQRDNPRSRSARLRGIRLESPK